jgi:hypothetical protein
VPGSPTTARDDEPPMPFSLVVSGWIGALVDQPALPSSSLPSHVDALGLPEVPAVALLRVAIAGRRRESCKNNDENKGWVHT